MVRWKLGWSWTLAVSGFVVLVAGCGGQDGSGSSQQSESSAKLGTAMTAQAAELFQLRNLARLHAARDSDEGNAEAARLLEQVVQRDPTSLDRLNLSRVLVFTQRFAEAGPHLTAAAADPSVQGPALDYVTGLFQGRMEDRQAAAATFAKVTASLPRHLQAWYQRGYAEERNGSLEEARTSYEKALEIDPRFRAALYRLVVVSRQLKDPNVDALFAQFQAVPQDGQPEAEKCDLTRVDLKPLERARVEPPLVPLAWKDASPQFLGESGSGTQRAIAFVQGDSSAVLLLPAANSTQSPRLVGVRGFTGAVELAAPGAWDARAGDLDNDGKLDVVVTGPAGLLVFMGGRELRFATSTRAFVQPTGSMAALELWDHDHDGDLDILAMRGGAPTVAASAGSGSAAAWFRNNGDRTFVQVEPSPFPSVAPRSAELWGAPFDAHDFDLGNDLDAVFCTATSPAMFLNRRDGSFATLTLGSIAAATIVRADDLDDDGAADVIAFAPSASGTTWSVARNAARDGLGSVSFEAHGKGGELPYAVRDAVLADPDNDGDFDALLATTAGFVVLRNTKGGHFAPEAPVPVSGDGGAVTIAAVDLDFDGRLEALVGTSAGAVVVFSVADTLPYTAWTLRLQGGRDNRGGIGAIGEHYAAAAYQSRIARGSDGLRFGLGAVNAVAGTPQIEGVRLRWPQGIVQSELASELVFDVPLVARVTQNEGLVASCPFLYAEGPDGWKFVTDIVGIAPLDEWLPPGQSPAFDPEEFVRIPEGALVPVDGRLRLAVTEELRETTYLDRVELFAVDHPEGTIVFADESTRQGAYDPLRIQLFERLDLRSPGSVTQLAPGRSDVDEMPSDATTKVAELDGVYLHPYPPAPPQWSGWVERHDVELVAPPEARWILLTGRIHWYDSTVSFALHQHGRTWGPLRLDQMDGGGGRMTLVPDLGLPCGMDRTMVSSFEPLSSPESEQRLLLSAHHRFLWDRILFASHAESFVFDTGDGVAEDQEASGGRVVLQHVVLQAADLEYHGFSRTRGEKSLHEQTYLFASAGPDDAFERARGWATRYGDVESLLTKHDDEVVVLVAGDRAVLEFAAPSDPGADRTRTYFLRVTGWAKEGSFHNATGRFIAPLPYRGMESYPPAAREISTSRRAYLDTYQTREVRG